MRGHMIPLSVPRRMVIDLLYFASKVPSVPVQKRMSVAALIAARKACGEKPRWTAIFTKAYALTARDFPELRRAYCKLPWPHLYEYPTSKASVIIEREYAGEPELFSVAIKDPERRSLADIGHELHHASTAPVDTIKDFRRAMRFARLPRPIRRAAWWVCLNFGRQRANYFGTFALSVYSALNAESLHPISPLTTLLNYGVMDSDGQLNVRIIYDHRVINGATVARALGRLEEILNTVVLQEVRAMSEGGGRAKEFMPTKAPGLR